MAIPETLPSSTPIIPEVVANVSDLDAFKSEMKSLFQQLENELILVKKGDWLPNCENFRDLISNVSLLDKVIFISYYNYLYSNLFSRLRRLKNVSTSRL